MNRRLQPSLIGAALLVCSACQPNQPTSAPVSQVQQGLEQERGRGPFTEKEVHAILESQDPRALSQALNEVKRYGATEGALRMLSGWWQSTNALAHDSGAREAPPDVLVRLDVAAILLQAHRNGELGNEPAGAHEFARHIARASEPRLAAAAFSALLPLENVDDADLIATRAAEDERLFRPAILTLAAMCLPAASEHVERLKSGKAEDEVKFISQAQSRLAAYRESTGKCR